MNSKGFTLIELVVVIVVLAIVGIGTTSFISLGVNIYTDVVGRDQIISQSRFMTERITRGMREALPNSVRVGSNGSIRCIEFVPILASSSYVDIPVFPEGDSFTVTVVQHAISPLDANKIVIYPLNVGDVYGSNASVDVTGNIFSYAVSPANGTDAQDITLDNSVRFDADSPTERYYLVKNAVSYCADVSSGGTTSGQMVRFDNYWPGGTQASPPVSWANGVLMAENIRAGSIPFTYSGATLVANAVVQLTLEFEQNSEVVIFNHEVHLVNVP